MRKIEGLAGLKRRANLLNVALLSALVLLLALPAGAFAAPTTVAIDGTVLRVTGDGTNNAISVDLTGGTYTVSDTAGTTAGAGCAPSGIDVTCPATGIDEAIIDAGAGDDTVIGSQGADTINGGTGSDNINGRGGADEINGRDGRDGGDGNDVMDTGTGGIDVDPGSLTYCADVPPFRCSEAVDGGQGFDTLTYATRTTRITADLRPGREFVRDADGTFDGATGGRTEKLIGGLANDELVGGLGPDTLNGGPGNAPDTLCGGLGKDTVDYSDKGAGVTVTLDGSLPTDSDIIATESTQSNGARQDCRMTIKNTGATNGQPCTIVGVPASCTTLERDCTANDGVAGENDCIGEDIENVIGTPFDDDLTGNDVDSLYGQGPRVEPQGENVLTGLGGDDLLDGGFGPDIFQGGDGNDTVTYELRAADDPVAASIDGAANDGSTRDFNARNNQSDQIQGDVEDLVGGDGDDILKGDNSDNGNFLFGGPGIDIIQGQGGPDTLGGDEDDDIIEGGAGGDTMEGGPGEDYLFGGVGGDSYDGGEGSFDTADFSDATTPVSVTLNGAADDGASEGDNVQGTIESLIGGLDDDQLNANDGAGILEGGGGNDMLNGGLGADILIGGVGNDTAGYGDHPGPVDVTLATPGGDGMADENDTLAEDVEGIGGSDFDDVLSGDGKLNFINGGPGNDRISGAEHDDFLAGDLGNDTINGDVGADTLDGAEGNDVLNGTAGNDTLRGFSGTDILDGGTGADTMSGGDGVDVVSYVSRSADVTVDTLGDPDDGEKGENDQVRTDVESVRTGGGDDNIDILDGAAGSSVCGAGDDEVKADSDDEIGSGCESGGVSQLAACLSTSSGGLKMASNGTVSVRMRCAAPAKGSVQLRSVRPVKVGKGKVRRINLGKKSFTGKRGQVVTVRVKISKSGRKAIQRKNRLRVEVTTAVRRDGANASTRTKRDKLTLRASGK